MNKGRVLVVAGSDSGGGAGIQADIKTVMALGGYASTAITALTAQNTTGVFGVIATPPEFVKQQIDVVLSDIGADAVKIGMLCNQNIIEATALYFSENKIKDLIIDPVMVATSGSNLLDPKAIDALKSELIKNADLVTPNIPEAEVLTSLKINSIDDMKRAGEVLLKMGAKRALIKGGHYEGDKIYDVLMSGSSDELVIKNKKINSKSTHGTGCTLASAIACHVALGVGYEESLKKSIEYVRKAIKFSKNFGYGNSPLNH